MTYCMNGRGGWTKCRYLVQINEWQANFSVRYNQLSVTSVKLVYVDPVIIEIRTNMKKEVRRWIIRTILKVEWNALTDLLLVESTYWGFFINPLKPELNPICYLLALLAHHFLHVSRIRVKSLTIRLLMSYIYGAPILDVSRSHTTTQQSR